MPKMIKPLSALQVKNAKPKEKDYKLFDGGGLFLMVTTNGRKLWRMKYRQSNGKESVLSFGSYPTVTLEQARRKRDGIKQLQADGRDPGQVAREEKLAEKNRIQNTFGAVTESWVQYMEPRVKPQTLKNYMKVINKVLLPHLADTQVTDIKPRQLLAIFRETEKEGKIATVKKGCQLCAKIMSYAIALEMLEINPVLSISNLLIPHKVTHMAAQTDPKRFGEILVAIENYQGTFTIKNALNMMPYVFVRTNELINAKWADINFETCEWRYTASKTDTPHVVPLAPQVIAILKAQKKYSWDSEYVFPHIYDHKKPMNNISMNIAMRSYIGISPKEMSVHGFRAVARTLLDEELGERYEYIEHQLAHTVRDPNGRAYNRTEHLAERKRMMCRWADYLDGLREASKQEANNQPCIVD